MAAAAGTTAGVSEAAHFATTHRPRNKGGSCPQHRRLRLATRQRVQERLLRRPIPCKEDVDAALEALAVLEEVRTCFPEGPSREDPYIWTEGALEKAWAALLNRMYSQHAEGITKELGPGTSFEPLYPDIEVQ